MEARRCCWVTHSGWSPHRSLSPQGQHQQLNNREAGPSNAWPTELQSRTPARCPCEYLTNLQGGPPARGLLYVPDGWTVEKDPRRGNSLNAWMGGATEKDWPRRPSDRQLQEATKDSGSVITPVAKAVCVSAHLAPPGLLQAKQLGHLHTQTSVGQSSHRQENALQLCVQGHFGPVQQFAIL